MADTSDTSRDTLQPITGELWVRFLSATNLLNKDTVTLSDPYVTVTLDADKESKQKTKSIEDSLNPVWNQEVWFSCRQAPSKMQLKLWDEDVVSDESLGKTEVVLDLSQPYTIIHQNIAIEKGGDGKIQFEYVWMPVTRPRILPGLHPPPLRVLLDKEVYLPGDLVQGIIAWDVRSGQTMRHDLGIQIGFQGLLHSKWSRTAKKKKQREWIFTTYHYASEMTPYFKVGPIKLPGVDTSQSPIKTQTHRWAFQYRLPDDLHPTTGMPPHPSAGIAVESSGAKYTLTVTVGKSRPLDHSGPKVLEVPIQIGLDDNHPKRPTDPDQLFASAKPEYKSQERYPKDLHITGHFPKRLVQCEDNQVQFEVQNGSKAKVESVAVEVWSYILLRCKPEKHHTDSPSAKPTLPSKVKSFAVPVKLTAPVASQANASLSVSFRLPGSVQASSTNDAVIVAHRLKVRVNGKTAFSTAVLIATPPSTRYPGGPAPGLVAIGHPALSDPLPYVPSLLSPKQAFGTLVGPVPPAEDFLRLITPEPVASLHLAKPEPSN